MKKTLMLFMAVLLFFALGCAKKTSKPEVKKEENTPKISARQIGQSYVNYTIYSQNKQELLDYFTPVTIEKAEGKRLGLKEDVKHYVFDVDEKNIFGYTKEDAEKLYTEIAKQFELKTYVEVKDVFEEENKLTVIYNVKALDGVTPFQKGMEKLSEAVLTDPIVYTKQEEITKLYGDLMKQEFSNIPARAELLNFTLEFEKEKQGYQLVSDDTELRFAVLFGRSHTEFETEMKKIEKTYQERLKSGGV